MLKTILIGNEKPMLETLSKSLGEITADIQVEASFGTVKESVNHLSHYPNADIIFSEVKLPDGLSFEIFSRANTDVPVVFVTQYDEFMLSAFRYIQYACIDYILNRTNKNEPDELRPEYRIMEKLFVASNNSLRALLEHANAKRKERLQVRKGVENILLYQQDVPLIYTENKIVFALDQAGKKYFVDKPLTDLEEELDRNMFFRANRQYIININYVRSFRAHDRVKLLVDVNLPEVSSHPIVVSQKTAPAFRKWVCDA